MNRQVTSPATSMAAIILGNLWRFDLNSSQSAVIGTGHALRFATLFADTGASQPQPIRGADARRSTASG